MLPPWRKVLCGLLDALEKRGWDLQCVRSHGMSCLPVAFLRHVIHIHALCLGPVGFALCADKAIIVCKWFKSFLGRPTGACSSGLSVCIISCLWISSCVIARMRFWIATVSRSILFIVLTWFSGSWFPVKIESESLNVQLFTSPARKSHSQVFPILD